VGPACSGDLWTSGDLRGRPLFSEIQEVGAGGPAKEE
jgi:hypothetical protein